MAEFFEAGMRKWQRGNSVWKIKSFVVYFGKYTSLFHLLSIFRKVFFLLFFAFLRMFKRIEIYQRFYSVGNIFKVKATRPLFFPLVFYVNISVLKLFEIFFGLQAIVTMHGSSMCSISK